MANAGTDLTATLQEIRQALATLTARVAALEAERATSPGAAPACDPVETVGMAAEPAPVVSTGRDSPLEAGIDPQVLTVIAAAVAAYLGERAHVKQVRLIGSHEWGRQGRVNVQASHALHR